MRGTQSTITDTEPSFSSFFFSFISLILPPVLSIGLLILTTSCENSTGPSLSSTNTGGVLDLTKPLANCSHDIANKADLSVRVITYSDGSDSMGRVRLKFDRFPSNFSKDTSAIEIWGFAPDSAGNMGTPRQLTFQFERYSGSGSFSNLNTTSLFQDLTWPQLQQLAQTNNLSADSAQQILGYITFLVNFGESSGATKLISIVIYDGNTIQEQVEILVPAFYANLADYAATHPAALVKYHPMTMYTTTGWTISQVLSQFQQFCF